MSNKTRTFGAARPRSKKTPIQTAFQRPDRLLQPLDVIVTVFNSARYRSRWKHYEDFVSHCELAGAAVRLWTVEVAFGNREFSVTNPHNERHLQLRTSCELWHKERSQNLLVQRVLARHPNAEYFAFIDADISFARHDWADECRHALQHFDVVQMWRSAYDLDASGSVITEHKSFAACYGDGMPVPTADQLQGGAGNDYGIGTASEYALHHRGKVYWHPGFCWGWRRSALDAVGGLIDFSVLGSADFHMAHALVGNVDETLRKRFARRYAQAFKDWETRAERAIKRNIGCMPGSIFHHWHGNKADRRYKSRWKILEETQFDHLRDLVTETSGLYRYQHHGNKRSSKLRDLTRRYFHERNEDG